MKKKMLGIVVGLALVVGAGCGSSSSEHVAAGSGSFNPNVIDSCMEQIHDADACHKIWDR